MLIYILFLLNQEYIHSFIHSYIRSFMRSIIAYD